MPKIDLNKSYNSSLITEVENKWTAFEGFQGSEVELFLKDKLEDSVVLFAYYSTGFTAPDTNETINNALVGLNAFGKVVCYERVINADISYTVNSNFQNITIGATLYNNNTLTEAIQVNQSDSLIANVTFTYLVEGDLAGNKFNETSALQITFKWFKDKDGATVDNTLDTFTRTITPGETIVLDITKMFENSFSNRYLGIVYRAPGKTDTGELRPEEVKIFQTPFTLRKLELSYLGKSLINSNKLTNIKLEGTANENLSTYKLDYYVDGTTKNSIALTDNMTSDSITLELPNLTEGAHDVYLRAVSSGNLTSNYIQISFIYQKLTDSLLTNAVAIVSEVPDLISNCNLSKFFKVVTTSNISGDVEIVALKSSTPSSLIGISTIESAKNSEYLFKEVSLSLLNTDISLEIDYTSYIEVPGNNDTSEYLKIIIKDGTGERSLYYYYLSNNTPARAGYKTINIVNPSGGSEHLQYTKGEILGFSQITNGNVFTDLSSNLDISNGLLLENVLDNANLVTMTTFKVSPTEGVFASPKVLLSQGSTPLHQSAFSIEMMFKTYGINDLDDHILTIGNITLCPKHLFVNHEPDKNSEPHHTVNASRADFRKDVIQHVVITYDPNYKPNTYETLYNKFFTYGSTNYTDSAQTYPCLKIYVNGTINRIISIGSSTICSENDFKFLIHPSNSNINFYVFRTYDKALSYEEVRKNRTSSMSKLLDKQNYYKNNDILYTQEDFVASLVSEKSSILNTISLGKCINKFKSASDPTKTYNDRKVLLVVLPEGILPPYYGNRKEDEPKATLLVHYPEVKKEEQYVPAETSGRLSGGKIKAQGSSAKKYMFHNTSYSKFTFTPESQFTSENPTTYNYYKMPGSDIEITKLVGKVNYASSMQSHKQGATKLFHEAYVDSGSGLDTTWMNGGRKAVLEDEFLYFFVNVPEEDLNTITWDYFKQEDGTYNFENCYFLGFQTWGSAKGDKATSGYDDAVPHYLMLEGADNDNSAANFKTPWASMQIWGNYQGGQNWISATSTVIEQPSNSPIINTNYYHLFAGGTKDPNTALWTPDYQTGLLIKDETIVFDPGTETGTSSDKKADAWDVDFGITEGAGYDEDADNLFFVFEDKVIESVNKFALFYNLIYTFDFSSLLYIPAGSEIDGMSMLINDKPSYQYKLVFGENCVIKYGNTKITPKAGNIYRWEKAWPSSVMANSEAKWVPAGLYHNGSNWEDLNVADICTWYSNAAKGSGSYPAEYSFFAKEEYKNLKAIGDDNNYKFILPDGYSFIGLEDAETELRNIQACMAEAFKIIVYEFMDINDVAYHQAFIKLVAGTDNRAKNTYFQIVGPIYTNKYTSNDVEVDILKTKDSEGNEIYGYITGDLFCKVNIVDEVVTETDELFIIPEETKKHYYKKTAYGDYKIRLYQDDLDTVFKTDNNGLQVKPYYLLEPPYNRDLEYLWGDMHSGFFYNFDLTCIPEVKSLLSKLLLFSTGNEWPDSINTKLYQYFFSILNNLPAIAYNHQSEIYYESTQTLWQDGQGTDFYNVFSSSNISSWKDFTNNKVYDPVSLSHGSCLEAEIEYLRDRVLLLSTYTNTAKNKTDVHILLNGGSSVTQGSEISISSDYTSFIQYIYPIINDIQSTKDYTGLDYDPLLDYMNWENQGTLDQPVYDYSDIDLIYNIALPNEPLDISVKFQASSLTTNSYWTSTDLYRTINIKSGTQAFSSLFNFPNASTVISQDPAYNVEVSEGKTLDVVDYLESIEHLVLQNATISSEGLNFLGCNRLKTLVLGSTEDNLTDSPEDTPSEDIEWYSVKFEDVLTQGGFIKTNSGNATTGFKLLILPKSSSIELIILPNCVEVININYYPNLTRFEFNSGTQLTNLTIDGRNSNSIIEYILSNFVGVYTTNLEITNIPNNFWLSEATCRKLTQMANVKITGTINIGDGINLTEIDWTTKRMLVEKFGNIETGELIFNYKKVLCSANDITVNDIGTIESSGPAPIMLQIDGNNIPIDSTTNKNLKIYYTIKDSSGNSVNSEDIRFQDKYTPNLIIKEGLSGTYIITTQVYYTTSSYKSLTTTITVGFYAPKPGDFAYANGSFSSICDPNQGLIGVVFYSNKTTTDSQEVYDVRVLSANYSSTDVPMGPADYASGFIYNSGRKSYLTKYNALLTAFGLDVDGYIADVTNNREGGSASGTITYDYTLNGVSLHQALLPNVSEHSYQKNYITRANLFLQKLKGISGLTVTTILDDTETLTSTGKDNFEKALREINSLLSISKNNETYSYSECDGFDYALYPAFLKALYYEPNVTLEGRGLTYFGLGNWYIPDSREMERLIYYRINSSITNKADTENNWNSTQASSSDVSGLGLNIFKTDAFNNIDFLKNSNSLITSDGTEDGESLTYGWNNYSGTPIPLWTEECSEYYGTDCARDVPHNISPVCRIVLTKDLS